MKQDAKLLKGSSSTSILILQSDLNGHFGLERVIYFFFFFLRRSDILKTDLLLLKIFNTVEALCIYQSRRKLPKSCVICACMRFVNLREWCVETAGSIITLSVTKPGDYKKAIRHKNESPSFLARKTRTNVRDYMNKILKNVYEAYLIQS